MALNVSGLLLDNKTAGRISESLENGRNNRKDNSRNYRDTFLLTPRGFEASSKYVDIIMANNGSSHSLLSTKTTHFNNGGLGIWLKRRMEQ